MSYRRTLLRLGVAGLAVVAAGFLLVWWRTLPEREVRSGLGAAIDSVVAVALEEGPIAGISVGVARGGRLLYTEGYGQADLENEVPATAATVYRIGSITKQFTAAALLRLVGEGRIGLEDPVTDYVDGFPRRDPPVTLRSLLNHTAGVPNYTTMERWWETMALEMDPSELVEVFLEEPFDFPVGERFSYSNSGYVLLGMVVERVTGLPYGAYLQQAIFEPLGLASTSYCSEEKLLPGRARGYRLEGGSFVNATYVSISQAYAAGGLCSTVGDLLVWSEALEEGQVVDEALYRRMIRPDTLADGRRLEYGFGFAVAYLEGHRRLSHVGGMLGFTGQIARYPDDDVTIVVLTNTENAKAAALETEIARVVLGLGEGEVRDILLAPAELDAYTGRYRLDLARIAVRTRDGRLEVEAALPGNDLRHVLLYQGEDRFLARDDPEILLEFRREDGRSRGFVLSRHGIVLEARRVGDLASPDASAPDASAPAIGPGSSRPGAARPASTEVPSPGPRGTL